MRASQIANRLTGISTPLGGLQWTPAKLDRDIARGVVSFLEDRRALYSPFEAEMPEYVMRSVFEIRGFLTDTIAAGEMADALRDPLRAMRVACRHFIDQAGRRDGSRLIVPSSQEMFGGGTSAWIFNQALGELRGAFGIHLAVIATRYNLDVPDELAVILPLERAGDNDHVPRIETSE